MANDARLLVVLPGASGRCSLIKRLQAIAHICVLVPDSHLKRSSWAKQLVGEDDWIEWVGETLAVDGAWTALNAWLSGVAARRIDGVFSYDEFGIELCAELCERLGLPCTPVGQMRILRDKLLFRERCTAAGIPAVRCATLSSDEDLDRILQADGGWRFPSVLKPRKGAGSWYMSKVDNAEDLRRLFAKLSQNLACGSFPQDIRDASFILEEYFDGAEVDIDGWARHGSVEFGLVSDNRPALEPHFLELGGVYPSQLPDHVVQLLQDLLSSVVALVPGLHGCFHFEAKINLEALKVMPIELNARVGGAECPACVEAVSGFYLPEVAARLALNLPVEREPITHAVVASTNLHRFEHGILRRCSDEHVDATATELVTSVMFAGGIGQRHVPNNGSQSCLGWMAAGGNDAKEAERNLQLAISQTDIVVEPQEREDEICGASAH